MDESLYETSPDGGGGRRFRWNFYTFFTIGVYFIGFLTVLGIFWSWFGFRTPDWLTDGRYVELTLSRYEEGTIEHFAFDEWEPPRSIGFYLFRHEDGTFTAVGDRPTGCVLVWQGDKDQLFDPCRGTKFPRVSLKEASSFGGSGEGSLAGSGTSGNDAFGSSGESGSPPPGAAAGPASPVPGFSNLVFLPLQIDGDELLVDLMPLLRGR